MDSVDDWLVTEASTEVICNVHQEMTFAVETPHKPQHAGRAEEDEGSCAQNHCGIDGALRALRVVNVPKERLEDSQPRARGRPVFKSTLTPNELDRRRRNRGCVEVQCAQT